MRGGLGSPRFLSFLTVQFLLALNDNAFKVSVLLVALAGVHDERWRIAYSSAVTVLFALPWLLLSPLAGYLADRFRKDRVLLAVKLPEPLLMILAVLGFQSANVPLLLCVFFLLTAESALFSPAKYGILPEIVGDEDLATANGLLGMTTHLAVLLGTALGGALAAAQGHVGNIGWVYVALAGVGVLCALYLPRARPGLPSAPLPANPLHQSLADLRVLRELPALGSTVLGIMYFTFLGALLLTLVPVYCSDVLGLPTDRSALVLTALVVGVALGSLAAGWLSRGRVELGLVPLGALIMALFSFDVAFFPERESALPLRALLDFALLGVGGGLFNVPLLAALQRQSPEHARGRVIAFSNVAGNLMVAAAAGLPLLLLLASQLLGVGSGLVQALMIALHMITVAGALYITARLPDYGVRFAVYTLVSLLYRLRISGGQHVPRGGALLVANHVSWVDALVVVAASGRMVRFMMYRPFYETPGLHWLLRRLHVIPVAGGDDAERTRAAIERAREEIRAGHTVCIFAEGAITRTGQLLEFRRGLERIAQGLDAPIVPVYLHGLWGSLFSFRGGRLLFKWPRRLRARVHVRFGAPLPSSSPAFAVRQAVQNLSVDAREQERDATRTLGLELLRSARRFWRRPFALDPELGVLRYGQALAAALHLRGAALADLAPDERRVGVLLPAGIAGTLANLAVLLAGRVPVNLPVESAASARAALRTAELRRVLGSPALWRALQLDYPEPAAGELERIARGECPPAAAALVPFELDAAGLARLRRGAWLRAGWLRALPLALARRVFIPDEQRDAQAAASVLFTRGSSGAAKAVVLSHRNLLSNLLALREVLDVGPEDRLLCCAALWHSFGFAAGIWLPLLAGASATHPRESRDGVALAQAARCARPTVLLATTTALAAATEAVPPDGFSELALVLTGGEPLAPELRTRFLERFGVQPLEGYGCAECSPLISLNVPDFPTESGRSQPGTRPGTHGHPLPGVAVQVVDAHTGAPLPPEQSGRIRVRGPNVARAYLGAQGIEQSPRDADGWYDTGDLGALDRAGFLTVSGRGALAAR